MIILFIILGILFIISLIFLLLCFSNLEIEIKSFRFNSNNLKNDKIEDYLFYIRLKLFDKITWLKIKIDDKKVSRVKKTKIFKKFNKPEVIEKIMIKNKKEIFKKNNFKYIKDLNISIKKIKLDMKLSITNTILTSGIVTIIASILSVILAITMQRFSKDNCEYVISPIYDDKLILKVKLNCIIDVKIVHIINVIYMLINKKGSVEYDERTSNRRTYVCSNDQHSRYG